jgi:hypothetical protein
MTIPAGFPADLQQEIPIVVKFLDAMIV